MALDFTEPKVFWVFTNKDRGTFEVPTEQGGPMAIPGIQGMLIGLRIREQHYTQKSLKSKMKCDFVFQDGEEMYILPFGVETFVTRWACYVILNGLVDLTIPIGFTISKKQDGSVLIPRWYQNKQAINVSLETWKSFPRTDEGGVDWLAVFDGLDMVSVVEKTAKYIDSIVPNSVTQPPSEDTVLSEDVALSGSDLEEPLF